MSSEQNKAIIRRWVKEAWNGGNLSVADELYAADYAYHDPSAPPMPPGPEGIKQVLSTYRSGLPDLRFDIEDMIAEGDKVTWRWSVHGTNTQTFMNIPASGKSVSISGIVISRFANGKWAEDWANWDTLGLLQQVGVIPVMG
jgi:steroid delta-isomerase-like uncharacterized protein